MARKKTPESQKAQLPKLPFSMCDRGAYINRPWVAIERMGKEYLGAVYFRFATGVVEACAVGVHEIDIDRNAHAGRKQFYVDGHHTMNGPTGIAKTHLQWLKNRALMGGATPDAIRLLKMVTEVTKKEEAEMAAKEKLAKKTAKTSTEADAGAAPVGKGGKAGATAKKSKGNPEALKKAREARAAAGPDTRKIKILNKENPYRAESNRAASFDALKGAKTVEDYVAAGGKTKYLSRWASEGRISLG